MRSKRFNKQTQINVLVNIKRFLRDHHCIFGSIWNFRIFFRESVRKNKPTPLKVTGNGVDDGVRTHDHRNHNPGLNNLNRTGGSTTPFLGERQNLNLRPPAPQAGALPKLLLFNKWRNGRDSNPRPWRSRPVF